MRANSVWDNLGQLAEKGGHKGLLLDIIQNYKTLFYQESCCKLLSGLWVISTCKAVDAGSIPTPASNPRWVCCVVAAWRRMGGNRESPCHRKELAGKICEEIVGRVVELVYTRHLKCLGASHAGSTPVSPTICPRRHRPEAGSNTMAKRV